MLNGLASAANELNKSNTNEQTKNNVDSSAK